MVLRSVKGFWNSLWFSVGVIKELVVGKCSHRLALLLWGSFSTKIIIEVLKQPILC